MSSTQKNIEQVVDLILEDYAGGRDIDKLETDRQPDKDVIIDVIEKLRRIMFPATSGIRPTGSITQSIIFLC